MENYDTVVAALNGLKARGYTIDFNMAFDIITCSENTICLRPDEFEITPFIFGIFMAKNPEILAAAFIAPRVLDDFGTGRFFCPIII